MQILGNVLSLHVPNKKGTDMSKACSLYNVHSTYYYNIS